MRGFLKQNLNRMCLFCFSLALLFITVVPFLILCLYNQPSDNDNWVVFYGFSLTNKYPIFSRILNFRMRGMFHFTELLDVVLFNHPDGFDYKTWMTFIRNWHIKALVWVFCFWGSCTILFKTLNDLFLKFKGVIAFFFYSIFLYFCFNGIHWALMVFYEHISANSYTSGCCYFLLFLSLSLRYYCVQQKKLKKIYLVLDFCVLYACVNCLEIYSFVAGFVIFSFMLYDYIKHKKINFYFVILLLLCLLIFLRDLWEVRGYVLPDQDGNIGKYSYAKEYSTLEKFFIIFESLIKYSLEYLDEILTERKYFPFILILIIGTVTAFLKNSINISVNAVALFCIPIIGVTFMFGLAVPEVFTMGRYTWTIYLFLTFYFFALLVSISLWFVNKVIKSCSEQTNIEIVNTISSFAGLLKKGVSKPIVIILLTCIGTFVMLVFTLDRANSTVAWAWKDVLKGTAATYNKEINDRYEKIFKNLGGAVELKPLSQKPHTLYYNDSVETDNIKYYRQCFRNDNIYLKDCD